MLKIEPQNLRTPGPTPIPDDIVEAMGNPMINHRGPEFDELISKVTAQLKQVFMTSNDLFILTASGTGALEASLVNTLSPGDKVVAATAGSFGDRFIDMADGLRRGREPAWTSSGASLLTPTPYGRRCGTTRKSRR